MLPACCVNWYAHVIVTMCAPHTAQPSGLHGWCNSIRHGNWLRIHGIPRKRIAFSAGKKLTHEKKFPGSFFSRGVKLIFRRSEATCLPQHRFWFLLCACAVAPLPLWLQAQSVNMSSMSRIVQHGPLDPTGASAAPGPRPHFRFFYFSNSHAWAWERLQKH